ncbi:MAG: 3-methyl-2-oxobutanoate hydroxymethyltransferase [Candidatus Omnitrophica bacterium]|nr:3-methyl-2-oxobutanoate hydroxymethyltransferase [Candidatus Omnitrophota bacterium]
MSRLTIKDIQNLKHKRKITMLTAYDYPFAALVDRAGIDLVLVGDSLANVVLGLESTKEVGVNDLIYHAKAVSRGVKSAIIVADMPFEAYQPDPALSLPNARRFIEEAGCDAVKIEWFERCLEAVKPVVQAGIPVMGHIGLTPQTADALGGFKVQGKDAESAARLFDQARALEAAGCFSLVLECVPAEVAAMISERAAIPVIGIGAGVSCDGQVLVLHDMLGLFDRYRPKFVKTYLNLSELVTEALKKYRDEVAAGTFPDERHSFSISESELKKLRR